MDDSRQPVDDQSNDEADIGELRSPIRPSRPEEPSMPKPEIPPLDTQTQLIQAVTPDTLPEDPQVVLAAIRTKMQRTADEFATGKINRAQFTALYKYYSEKLAIIEKLMERDPASNAWKQAAEVEHTTFLRTHFEARPLYAAVFKHNQPEPLLTDGKAPPGAVQQIAKLFRATNALKNRPPTGLARKPIGEENWLVLAFGAQGITFVIFSLQPSSTQTEWINDLHVDFERANRFLLERGITSKARLVFPQRAIFPIDHPK